VGRDLARSYLRLRVRAWLDRLGRVRDRLLAKEDLRARMPRFRCCWRKTTRSSSLSPSLSCYDEPTHFFCPALIQRQSQGCYWDPDQTRHGGRNGLDRLGYARRCNDLWYVKHICFSIYASQLTFSLLDYSFRRAPARHPTPSSRCRRHRSVPEIRCWPEFRHAEFVRSPFHTCFIPSRD
jgi:hypothetical protein